MLEKLEIISQMFHGFEYENYFVADTSGKLSWILRAEDFILDVEDGKKRFVNEVTALGKAFAIAIPHDKAMDVKDEVSFFQAVKARLCKFDSTGDGRTDEEIETTIRQVIDQALVSEKVIDIFDAAGIKKPDISILSEEFLMELKGMEHKNIALEVLRKLLSDEIKVRAKRNCNMQIYIRRFSEKLNQQFYSCLFKASFKVYPYEFVVLKQYSYLRIVYGSILIPKRQRRGIKRKIGIRILSIMGNQKHDIPAYSIS